MFTTPTIIGLIFIVIGIILVIIGIVFFEINVQNTKKQPWWVWFLIGLGVFITVIGAILTIVYMKGIPDVVNYDISPGFGTSDLEDSE